MAGPPPRTGGAPAGGGARAEARDEPRRPRRHPGAPCAPRSHGPGRPRAERWRRNVSAVASSESVSQSNGHTVGRAVGGKVGQGGGCSCLMRIGLSEPPPVPRGLTRGRAGGRRRRARSTRWTSGRRASQRCCRSSGLLPSPRTNWTRRIPHPVLIGHAASLSQVPRAHRALRARAVRGVRARSASDFRGHHGREAPVRGGARGGGAGRAGGGCAAGGGWEGRPGWAGASGMLAMVT